MQVPTHILSGWCVANLFPTTPGQRLCAMIAASAADVDGLGILFSRDAYWDYHHTVGHNLFAGLVIAGLLAWATPPHFYSFLLYVGLAHLHLLLDCFGSGPGWPIHYLWPWKIATFRNLHAWPFYSWENMVAFGALLLWMLWIVRRRCRTPVELIAPRLDRLFVDWCNA